MTDVLIRDVPDDVIAALDAHAGRLRAVALDAVVRCPAEGDPTKIQLYR